jgi:hypothetical protein
VGAAILAEDRGAEHEERPLCSSPAVSSSRRQNPHGHPHAGRVGESLKPEPRRAEDERRTLAAKNECAVRGRNPGEMPHTGGEARARTASQRGPAGRPTSYMNGDGVNAALHAQRAYE